MAQIANAGTDQYNERTCNPGSQEKNFHKKGKQDKSQDNREYISGAETQEFPREIFPFSLRLESYIFVKDEGIRDGNDIRKDTSGHIGDIARFNKALQKGVQPNKYRITKDRIPDSHEYKPGLNLVPI
jgi:hypothetical protein